MRDERRRELTMAFARVLAEHGYSGATIAAVADAAGVAPGLVHHHFNNKDDLMMSLVDLLQAGFRRRQQATQQQTPNDALLSWGDAALALGDHADVVAARCWVGVFAEALRQPTLFARMRRMIDTELNAIKRRSDDTLDDHAAAAVLAFVIGALVLGAFAPKKTAGFAAPALRRLLSALKR